MMHSRPPHNKEPAVPPVRRLTKLLLSVTVRDSVGAVQVIMSPENTVGDLIKVVVEVYKKERRRPLLSDNHPTCFGLHYSPFSLQSLKVEEKVINLGSRNFFLCQKVVSEPQGRTCLDQANKMDKSPFPLVKLMDFLL